MKAIKKDSYRKADTGKMMFRYHVTGTKEELKAYAKAQGVHYREDDGTTNPEDKGKPLFFSNAFVGKTVELGISRKGNVYAKNDELEEMKSAVESVGGDFAQAFANQAAAHVASSFFGRSISAPVSQAPAPKAPEASVKETEENLNEG